MKRDGNEQTKQKNNIFENHIIENLKKYYNIDDHRDLLTILKNRVQIIIEMAKVYSK